MSDKPSTPLPDPSARRRQTDSERAAEARRYLAEYERRLGAAGLDDVELAAMEAQQRASVPVWGLELGRQQSDMERTLDRLVATTEHVVSSVRETTEQMRGLGAQVQGLSDAVKGRGGAEVRLEALERETARLAQWQTDRDAARLVDLHQVQRGWWDKGLGMVGATLVGLLLGGGAVGVVALRACEPAPVVKAPSP
jgi:predicted metal-dependent hydrolase